VTHFTTGKDCGDVVKQQDKEVLDLGHSQLMCDSLIVCCKEVTYSVVGRGKAYTAYLEGKEVKVTR
jgi:hypothetical protein